MFNGYQSPAPAKAKHWCNYFPMAYTLLTCIAIFGVILVIAETASTAVAAGLFFALEVWLIYVMVRYTLDFIYSNVSGWLSVLGYYDVFVALVFGFAGVWHGIFMLDPTQFLQSGASGSQFRLYVAFLFASAGLLATVGFGSFIPRGLFAELWGVFGVFQSIWFVTMLAGGLISNRIKPERHIVKV